MALPYAEQDVEVDEELQPLDEGVPRAASRGGRTRAALLALGLGTAAAAAYTFSPGSGSQPARPSAAIGLAKALDPDTLKLGIESDLGSFITADRIPGPSHGLGGSLVDAALDIFRHALKVSDVIHELTGDEYRAFENRFVAKMIGMADSNDGPYESYITRARRHIQEAKPVMTKMLAEAVNMRQSGYKVAMKDWMVDESIESLNQRLIQVPFEVPEGKELKGNMGPATTRDLVPPSFDSRDMWPMCREVIEKAHNQGRCGSCWVFGALGALDSRMCIATMGKFSGPMAMLSRGFGASCAVDWDGCQGGWPHQLYDFIEQKSGIPSSSCVPYFGGQDYADHWHSSMPAPKCPNECDSRYGRAMQQDFFRPLGVGNYKVVTKPDEKGLEDMRAALYNGGPVPFALSANYEFMGYDGGIFDGSCGSRANHAVQAIGYGEGYFLGLNSWGPEWGEKGTFKVAPCMIYHYAVPGEIQAEAAQGLPLPFPGGSEPLDREAAQTV